MLKFNQFSVFSSEIIPLVLIIMSANFGVMFYVPIQATTQNMSNKHTHEIQSSMVYRTLVDDAIKLLQSGDRQGTLVNLKLIKEQLVSSGMNSSLAQMVNVLINDAINSLQNGDIQGVLIHLNLINQQLNQPATIPTEKLTETKNKTNMINSSENVHALISQAHFLEGQHKLRQAIKYYGKALEIEPNNTVILSNMGFDLNQVGNNTEAIKYADKALRIDPTFKFALNTKGNALLGMRNYTEAIKYYNRALEIDPNFVPSLTNKAYCLTELGNYTEAIKYYNRALEIDPNFVYAIDGRNMALSLSLTKSASK